MARPAWVLPSSQHARSGSPGLGRNADSPWGSLMLARAAARACFVGRHLQGARASCAASAQLHKSHSRNIGDAHTNRSRVTRAMASAAGSAAHKHTNRLAEEQSPCEKRLLRCDRSRGSDGWPPCLCAAAAAAAAATPYPRLARADASLCFPPDSLQTCFNMHTIRWTGIPGARRPLRRRGRRTSRFSCPWVGAEPSLSLFPRCWGRVNVPVCGQVLGVAGGRRRRDAGLVTMHLHRRREHLNLCKGMRSLLEAGFPCDCGTRMLPKQHLLLI